MAEASLTRETTAPEGWRRLLARQLLEILERFGARRADSARLSAELLRDFPTQRIIIEMLRRCGPHLADVVAGRANGHDILFSGEGHGLLEFQEITQLSLSADLVTLSACDTANGKLEGEEGIDGLAEAFLLAGAKSVVGALWDVEDSATESLMKAFYSHLAQGQDKASALRQAKLDYLQRSASSSPVYWAPFTLIGDGSAPIIF